MAEKDEVFASSVKYAGIVSYSDFYQFCYNWLTQETGLSVAETEYSEKVKGEAKEINITWEGSKKMTDYFKFAAKVTFKIIGLTKVEINDNGRKIKTNQVADLKVSIKGTIVRDYNGKFETSAFKKFLRGTYEKWVIPTRIEEFEDKIIIGCDEFLSQVKAYLDLEGKR